MNEYCSLMLTMPQIHFRLELRPRPTCMELMTLPRPLSRLGGAYPSPFPTPHEACGVSFSAPHPQRHPLMSLNIFVKFTPMF